MANVHPALETGRIDRRGCSTEARAADAYIRGMAMVGHDETQSTAENYRRFALLEASGRSATYEALALAVAEDRTVLAFLERLPAAKRQPNLLFAAARHVLGRVPDIGALRELTAARAEELAAVILERRTQTNEPGRCATLVPALGLLDGPLAVIEVGASAGLCLNLTRYSYRYGSRHIAGSDPAAPTLRCEVLGGTPSLAMPDVVWAAGIDLHPLDPVDSADRSWLECLVWPDQPERAARLSAALDTAVRHPVPVHEGDLLDRLPGLLEEAPSDATPVVFHSAVLAYLDDAARARFRELVQSLDVVWLANEAPGVVVEADPPAYDTSPFVLTVDGERVAYTHPHGDWIDWTA